MRAAHQLRHGTVTGMNSTATTDEPTWSFCDNYVAFPLAAESRTDLRTVAEVHCMREHGSKGLWTVSMN